MVDVGPGIGGGREGGGGIGGIMDGTEQDRFRAQCNGVIGTYLMPMLTRSVNDFGPGETPHNLRPVFVDNVVDYPVPYAGFEGSVIRFTIDCMDVIDRDVVGILAYFFGDAEGEFFYEIVPGSSSLFSSASLAIRVVVSEWAADQAIKTYWRDDVPNATAVQAPSPRQLSVFWRFVYFLQRAWGHFSGSSWCSMLIGLVLFYVILYAVLYNVADPVHERTGTRWFDHGVTTMGNFVWALFHRRGEEGGKTATADRKPINDPSLDLDLEEWDNEQLYNAVNMPEPGPRNPQNIQAKQSSPYTGIPTDTLKSIVQHDATLSTASRRAIMAELRQRRTDVAVVTDQGE